MRKNLSEIQRELLLKGEFVNQETCKTISEIKFGEALLNSGIKLFPDYHVGDYAFDFKIKKYPILIEIDGSIHWTKDKHNIDMRKMRYASKYGFTTLRFGNDEKESVVISDVKRTMQHCKISPIEIYIHKVSFWQQVLGWFK